MHRWGGAENFLAWPTTLNLTKHNFFNPFLGASRTFPAHVCMFKKENKRGKFIKVYFLSLSSSACLNQTKKSQMEPVICGCFGW